MKRIEIKKKGNSTVTIETKWLRIEEAAAYLGVVRSTFDELRRRIPHGEVSGVVVYDCNVLDRWTNREFPEEYYEEEKTSDVARKHRRAACRFKSADDGLVNPKTGRVFKPNTTGKQGRRGSALRSESLPHGEKQITATASPL